MRVNAIKSLHKGLASATRPHSKHLANVACIVIVRALGANRGAGHAEGNHGCPSTRCLARSQLGIEIQNKETKKVSAVWAVNRYTR
jgi:hypothetical protein